MNNEIKKNPFSLEGFEKEAAKLRSRHRKERRFRFYGLSAIFISFFFLGFLMLSIFTQGYSAFLTTKVKLDINFAKETVDPYNTNDVSMMISSGNFPKLLQDSLKAKFPDVKERQELFDLYALVSKDADVALQKMLDEDNSLLGKTIPVWLSASSDVDMLIKGRISLSDPEDKRRINDKEAGWVKKLQEEDRVKRVFNYLFFTEGDSRAPEQAGILGGLIGSLLTIAVCMLVAFPIGVLTALYLEEFAPKNKFTDIIEVNINNLAAVPSIVFGLLGLAIYINNFGLPRSSAIVGGLTLALLILPTIVITTRNSIKTIPQSIKDAATALGASPIQVAAHHTIPLAMPGIMTGTILSVARAIGETAPLLMIGMVAFVADVPKGFADPSSALPVQVFLWSDSPEFGFLEKTSAAIIVLLFVLVALNAFAVYLRKKFEVKW